MAHFLGQPVHAYYNGRRVFHFRRNRTFSPQVLSSQDNKNRIGQVCFSVHVVEICPNQQVKACVAV